MRERIAMLLAIVALAAGLSSCNLKNCTTINRFFPHGVGLPGAVDHVSGSTRPVTNYKVDAAGYRDNKGSDADKDGIACEQP